MKIKVVICLVILLAISNITYAKFISIIDGKGIANLKNPIIVLEKGETISNILTKNIGYYEYNFSLKNYLEETNKVNEIPFEYKIKLEPSTSNFPVDYKLINLNSNVEIPLNENLETDNLMLDIVKEKQDYKVVASWKNLDTKEEVDKEVCINIKIIANQKEIK